MFNTLPCITELKHNLRFQAVSTARELQIFLWTRSIETKEQQTGKK